MTGHEIGLLQKLEPLTLGAIELQYIVMIV